MEHPAVLLIEDDDAFRKICKSSLEESGCEVMDIADGNLLEGILHGFKVDIILSDSDLPGKNGYSLCSDALKKKLIDDSVLIIGMSGESENQKYWRGVANFGGFYNKLDFEHLDVGKSIMNCWKNFERGGIYREKMPLVFGLEEE